MEKVSVVVPVYNADRWIQECLDSIKSQTYRDIELIVVDDPNGTGAAAARNRGLDRATGEYIVFCDADDYLEPDAIRVMVDAIAGVDFVAGSFRKFGDFDAVVSGPPGEISMRRVAEYAMGNLRNPRSNQLLSGCWAKLFKRELAGRFPEIATAEDMAFNFNYLLRCDRARFIPDLIYHNRKRPGSLSTTYDSKNKPGLFGFLSGLKHVRKFLSQYYWSEEIEDAIDNSKVYHSMLYFTRICDQEGGTMREVLRKLYP